MHNPQRTHTRAWRSRRGPSLARKRGRDSPPTYQKKTLTTFKSLEEPSEGALTPSSSPLSSIRSSAEFHRPALPKRARFRASLTISLPALARQKEMTPLLWQEDQILTKKATMIWFFSYINLISSYFLLTTTKYKIDVNHKYVIQDSKTQI